MKIIIKNPAPTDSRQKKWGDYHFGRCLGKYLTRLGAEVVTHYQPTWERKDSADVVIVLRGKYIYRPIPGRLNILWIISHPGAVTAEECESYDAVCAASYPHAEILKQQLSIPVFPLLQCTDTEEFFTTKINKCRKDIIFIGNTRGVPRPCVNWVLEYGLPLKIWGRGWKEWIDPEYIVADYIRNEELGRLYEGARFTLNDHWNDMRSLGYINNRIFDGFACGLPVISDYHKELHRLFPEEIPYYASKEEFFDCIEKMLFMYPHYEKKIAALRERIQEEFSFENRAIFIFDLIEELKKINSKSETNTPNARSGNQAISKPFFLHKDFISRIKKEFALNNKLKFCPVCGARPDKFLTFGSAKHSDARCPSCNSLKKHRLFWIYFQCHLYRRLTSGTKHFLHITPDAYLAKLFQEIPEIDYISADVDSPSAMVKIDLTKIQFADSRFDTIIYSNDRIPDNRIFIQEMFRVLRPKGFLIFQLSEHSDIAFENSSIKSIKKNKKYAAEFQYVHIFGLEIVERLKNSGFTVNTFIPYDELGSTLTKFLGVKNQIIFECHKKQ